MTYEVPYLHEKWMQQPELDLAYESKPKKKDAQIKYYRQPCLKHGGNIMVKGIVYVEWKSKT